MGAALNAVYDHYLSSLLPRQATRFDSHKRSELRHVYNSMVKLNKTSPWYLLPGKEGQAHAIILKEQARALHNALIGLGDREGDGLPFQKCAGSSDEEYVSASYIGSGKPSDDVPEFDVEIRSLASPQENTGVFLDDTRIALSPNTYSFDISINDMNYEFQFYIGEYETNREVQNRLARLINGSDIGLKASLAEAEGKTALRLTSESAGLSRGKTEIFRISDGNTSGVVSYLGLGNIEKKASNAVYLIGGQEYTGSSNQITVQGLYELQLKKVTPLKEAVHVGLKTDLDSLTDNIARLVSSYNTFLSTAAAPADTSFRSGQLANELKDIASAYASSFHSMGIELTDKGALQVDKELLRQAAAAAGDIPALFSPIRQFAAGLLDKSIRISLNPMEYIEKKVVAYKNPSRCFISPYTPGAYSGMMFNGYC